MSAVLASASVLKPEIRLARAVSQFEADLSSEQKATFRATRSQSRDSIPTTDDVMLLTAELDRRVGGGRRCFGPRFTNILRAIQQFVEVGDVVVGGSQNIIACGVWALMIVNVSSYVDKLSSLFMTVGRSAPRYQAMAELCPRSNRLQANLAEYFIVVVDLCRHLFTFSTRSTLGQLTSSLSDSKLNRYQSDLEKWANLIKEEMDLVTSQSVVEEARENSRFRALSSKRFESKSRRMNMKTRLAVLDFCSTYDSETTWKQTRKAGHATLFNQRTEYKDWRTRSDSCTLLMVGKLGSGKSVLLANIVDDLNLFVQNEKIPVVYFFCRHDIAESLKARTAIGSLARQLLGRIPDLTAAAKVLDENPSVLDPENIFILLQRTLPPKYKAYVIVDGLDECDAFESRALIQLLRRLQELYALLLCVSFRAEADIALRLKPEHFTTPSIISIPDDNPDIGEFISAELESCIQSGKLALGDAAVILEIRDALLERTQGMFLWAALQIECLCEQQTDEAIRQALLDLPKDLSETYSRILRRSQKSGKPYQRWILELVMVAQRPLTTAEIREALSVVPGDTVWNPARLLNDVYLTLVCCRSLITVDEEELTIRLVHHSVKQFLLGEFKDPNGVAFTIDGANRTMAEIIVTYLNFGVFGTQLSIAEPQVLIESAPSRIILSTMNPSSNVQNLALKLLRSRNQPKYDIRKTLEAANGQLKSRSVDEFQFYSYAKSNWLQHTWCISEPEPVMYNLLRELVKRKAFDKNTLDEDGRTPLSSAAAKGYGTIVKLLIATDGINLNLKDGKCGQTPLSWAAQNGHERVVKLLLASNGVDPDSEDNVHGKTPLLWAAENGHEGVVKLFFAIKGVNPNSKDRKYDQTLLSWAAMDGQEGMVRLLLATEGVDADHKSNRNMTPLSLAAEYGHEAVVRMFLLADGVDPNSKNNLLMTPLMLAADEGHEAVVRLLLATDGVEVDHKSSMGRTALSLAAREGHEAVVKLLLATDGVDPDSKDNEEQTPLSAAAENGHEAVARLLLATDGVDPDSNDIAGMTPLAWSARAGKDAVAKLLLATDGVDPDSKDAGSSTPLLWASRTSVVSVVKLLLATKSVDLNWKEDDSGRTPLLWAASTGKEEMVKLLIAADGVDLHAKDKINRTALFGAAERGSTAVVQLLLATACVVDINERESYFGETALATAAKAGHEDVVKLLLATDGVDWDAKDRKGRTPLSLATKAGHTAVAKLLQAKKIQSPLNSARRPTARTTETPALTWSGS